LSPRETQVLGCLAAGMSADAIAGQLFLSRNTIRTHIHNMLRKLHVHSVLAAAALARRAGPSYPDPAHPESGGHAERGI
jgi:DNA-binding NarL/FixJ family response regulator